MPNYSPQIRMYQTLLMFRATKYATLLSSLLRILASGVCGGLAFLDMLCFVRMRVLITSPTSSVIYIYLTVKNRCSHHFINVLWCILEYETNPLVTPYLLPYMADIVQVLGECSTTILPELCDIDTAVAGGFAEDEDGELKEQVGVVRRTRYM